MLASALSKKPTANEHDSSSKEDDANAGDAASVFTEEDFSSFAKSYFNQ